VTAACVVAASAAGSEPAARPTPEETNVSTAAIAAMPFQREERISGARAPLRTGLGRCGCRPAALVLPRVFALAVPGSAAPSRWRPPGAGRRWAGDWGMDEKDCGRCRGDNRDTSGDNDRNPSRNYFRRTRRSPLCCSPLRNFPREHVTRPLSSESSRQALRPGVFKHKPNTILTPLEGIEDSNIPRDLGDRVVELIGFSVGVIRSEVR
jgi:hypothetical protein